MNLRPQFDHQIKGFCPMGCGETLFVGEGGYITCSYIPCPKPDAAAVVLAERETEHIVEIKPRDFSIMHPLRERLGQELLKCDLHWHLVSLPGPPVPPGRYRPVRGEVGEWTWEEVEQP